jgi:hypothetical protein
MKYIVELKYTNPGHEHISLRRRVDSVARVVEASNEEEAINRAANQQRALGFKIQEAKVINEEQRTTTFPIGGGVVNLPKNLPSEKDGTAKLYDPEKHDKKLSPPAMMKKEEVGADKRDAGYKMSPAVRKAQGESDRLSKVVKPVQAGTLAAVHKSMERTMERNMKKEAADPGSMRVVNKKVKAADKMISAAKKAATVNLEPELKITRPMV